MFFVHVGPHPQELKSHKSKRKAINPKAVYRTLSFVTAGWLPGSDEGTLCQQSVVVVSVWYQRQQPWTSICKVTQNARWKKKSAKMQLLCYVRMSPLMRFYLFRKREPVSWKWFDDYECRYLSVRGGLEVDKNEALWHGRFFTALSELVQFRWMHFVHSLKKMQTMKV